MRANAYWRTESLLPLVGTDENITRLELPDEAAAALPDGAVVLLAGPAYVVRYRKLGLNLSRAVDWIDIQQGFRMAFAALGVYDGIEHEAASLLRGAFGRLAAQAEPPLEELASVTRLIERNGKIDKLTRLLYRGIFLILVRDIEGFRRLLHAVTQTTSIDEEEFISNLQAHGFYADVARGSARTSSTTFRDRVSDALQQLQPRILAKSLPFNVVLRAAASDLERELRKANTMRLPLTLDCTGVGASSRVSTPSMALLSHMVGLGSSSPLIVTEFGQGEQSPSVVERERKVTPATVSLPEATSASASGETLRMPVIIAGSSPRPGSEGGGSTRPGTPVCASQKRIRPSRPPVTSVAPSLLKARQVVAFA